VTVVKVISEVLKNDFASVNALMGSVVVTV